MIVLLIKIDNERIGGFVRGYADILEYARGIVPRFERNAIDVSASSPREKMQEDVVEFFG